MGKKTDLIEEAKSLGLEFADDINYKTLEKMVREKKGNSDEEATEEDTNDINDINDIITQNIEASKNEVINIPEIKLELTEAGQPFSTVTTSADLMPRITPKEEIPVVTQVMPSIKKLYRNVSPTSVGLHNEFGQLIYIGPGQTIKKEYNPDGNYFEEVNK